MATSSNLLLDLSARPIIAHRGASNLAPENTIEAFRLAVEHGADALELDVRLSADGEAVVIHDATLDRTTDLRGPVDGLTAAQLGRADAGAMFSVDHGRSHPWRGRGVRIPRLADVLREFPQLPLLIETKEAAVQGSVQRALIAAEAEHRCVVASDRSLGVRRFREPPFVSGACRGEIAALYFGSLVRQPRSPAPYRLLAVPERFHGLRVPTPRFVAAARRLGCPVHVWTVNQVESARRLWAGGVAGIITDDPGVMRRARAGEAVG